MSRFNQKGHAAGNLGAIVTNLRQRFADSGVSNTSKELAGFVLGMESLTDANAIASVNRTGKEMVSELKALYSNIGVSVENLTEQQLEAGAMVMMAAGNLTGYATAAGKMTVSAEGATLVEPGAFGNFDYRLKASVEAYDERELRQYLPYSIAMNIEAARQSEFSEALYRTVVLSPDQAGMDITVYRTMVFNEIKHDITGRAMDFHRRNLIDAVVDASVLSSESTLVVPVYITGNAENVAKFSTIPAAPRTVDGHTFDTAPLALGKTIDILGLASTPNITGTQDSTDALDHRMHVENLYLKFVVGGDTSIVKFPTMHLGGSQFQKSAEGLDRAMVLNFQTIDLPITKATKDISDAPAAALQGLAADTVVRLGVNLGGNANLQLGNVSVMGGDLSVDSVWTISGTGEWSEVTDPVARAAVVALVGTMSVAGYDLYATRSNLNRRMLGIKGDVVAITERHLIPMGAPITSHHPITSNNELVTMASLTNIARIRNDINAVTQLLSYDSILSSLAIDGFVKGYVPNIEGVGRHLLAKPYYKQVDFDVALQINTLKSHERAEDVSAALINVIRQAVYEGYAATAYQAALDAVTGGTEKPTVVIATDPTIARHLIVPGDTRLMSIGFDYKVVSSLDSRMKGKIFVTLTRPNVSEPNGLSFGCFAWMPELVSTAVVTRGGQVSKEPMVQPRTRHINTLPFLIRLDIENLAAAVTDRVVLEMDQT